MEFSEVLSYSIAMKQPRLFTHRGKDITKADFVSALSKLGVKKGDIVLAHSGLQAFGKMSPRLTKETLAREVTHALLEAIGKSGTLVMPTFTYTFCKSRVFDSKKTRSEVGMLSEYFRAQKSVVRSRHPIFSVAASGKDAEALTDVDMDSFGQKSFFAHLFDANGTILFLGGALFRNSCTFCIFIEQQEQIPYRFFKKFSGTLTDGSKKQKITARYFVRPLNGDVSSNNSKLEKILRKKKLLKEVRLGASSIRAVKANDLYREAMLLLQNDTYALLDHKPQV